MADGTVEYLIRLTDRTKAGTRSAVDGSRKLENQTKQTARAVDHLGDESVQTGRQITTMNRRSKTATGGLRGMATGLRGALGGVSGLAGGVAGLAVAMGGTMLLGSITSAIGGLKAFGQQIADLRNDISDASTRSGIATDTLQGLRLAAEGSGLSFSALTSSLDQFGRRLTAAAEGGNATADAFETLGVTVRDDLTGELRDGDEVFRETLEALNAMETGALRSSLAMDTLGRSGGKLLQALSGTQLQAFVALAEEFGVKVGPKAAAEAGKWQRATAELETVMAGLKGEVFDMVGGTDALFAATEAMILGFEFAKGAIKGFADGMDNAVNRMLAPFESLVNSLTFLLTSLEQIGNGDFTGGLFTMRVALDELKRAATETPAAIGSVLTGGIIEAGFTAGFEGAKAADTTGMDRVKRLRQLRADILSGGVTPDPQTRRDDEDDEDESAARQRPGRSDLAAIAAAAAGGPTLVGRAGGLLGPTQEEIAAARRARLFEGAQTGIAVGTQVLGGDAGGAISSIAGATGRAGLGVAGAAVSGLQFIGEQGVKGIKESLKGLQAGLLTAIEALPELIGQVLPNFAISLIQNLIPALIEAAPQIFFALLVELPVAIAKALGEVLREIFKGDEEQRGARIGAVLGGVAGFVLTAGNPLGAAAGAGGGAAVGAAAQDIFSGRQSRSSSSARTATNGQAAVARESDRLAMMSTRPRRSQALVRSNPFDDLARQYDAQYGTYGRASSTTIRPAS